MTWEGLNPPYATIVADPPWHYDFATPPNPSDHHHAAGRLGCKPTMAKALPYSSMSLDEIKALPVSALTDNGRCFMWVTNRYLRHGWDVIEAWGFQPQGRTLVWCKPPMGTLNVTTEFVLIGKKGNPPRLPWHSTTWFDWARPHGRSHSRKPDAFADLVESWCPGPYVELFARAPRLGWDSWGLGYES